MATHHSLLILAIAVFLLIRSSAADITDDCGMAVYWGQDSREGSLKDTCDTGTYKYVIIGKLTLWGPYVENTTLSFGDRCNPNDGGYTYLGEEIKHCQSKGIKVLLSIVGTKYLDEYSQPLYMAYYLRDTFLNKSKSGPFGDAAVDGFDFTAAEGDSAYYFYLTYYFLTYTEAYLTASQRCPLSDPFPLEVSIEYENFKKIWVQYFDEPSCDYSSGIDNLVKNWNLWKTYGTPIGMSLPASPCATQTGYMSPETVNNKILPRINHSDLYVGVAIWNRYYDVVSNYSAQIKRAVCDGKDTIISQAVV